jgi:nitroreductase
MPLVSEINPAEHRRTEHDVEPIFIKRWSPRAMSGEPIAAEDLARLLEAARWAPSAYNEQPWRFLYCRRNTELWPKFFDLLVEFNQQWTRNAGALLVVISKTTFDHDGKPNRTHSFDTGAAWQNLALQGAALGLVVHGMAGFDAEKARKTLHIPAEYRVEAMIAVGQPGRVEDLPREMQQREQPSDRKPLAEIATEGPFRS